MKNTKKLLASIFVGVAVFLLSGCGHQNSTKKMNKRTGQVATSLDVLQQYEAKLSDIPVPLDSKPLMDQTDIHATDNVMLCYDNEMDCQAVIEFYEREMERSGWQADGAYKGFEALLNFSKPARFCSVSIRPRVDMRKRIANAAGVGIFITTGPIKILA